METNAALTTRLALPSGKARGTLVGLLAAIATVASYAALLVTTYRHLYEVLFRADGEDACRIAAVIGFGVAIPFTAVLAVIRAVALRERKPVAARAYIVWGALILATTAAGVVYAIVWLR